MVLRPFKQETFQKAFSTSFVELSRVKDKETLYLAAKSRRALTKSRFATSVGEGMVHELNQNLLRYVKNSY